MGRGGVTNVNIPEQGREEKLKNGKGNEESQMLWYQKHAKWYHNDYIKTCHS
jgi:hypothetical protein